MVRQRKRRFIIVKTNLPPHPLRPPSSSETAGRRRTKKEAGRGGGEGGRLVEGPPECSGSIAAGELVAPAAVVTTADPRGAVFLSYRGLQ